MSRRTRWSEASAALSAALQLRTPPIAITFSGSAPAGVVPFDSPMPEPTPDGRTGRVSAGCVFWTKAVDRTFATVAADHGNCSVGSLTHGFATLDEVAGRADVAALLESGWVTMDMIPAIPVVADRPDFVVYGPLADTPVDPDVVLIRINGKQLMVLSDALPGLAHRRQASVPHRGGGQATGGSSGERGLHAEPHSYRHAKRRDDVRHSCRPP